MKGNDLEIIEAILNAEETSDLHVEQLKAWVEEASKLWEDFVAMAKQSSLQGTADGASELLEAYYRKLRRGGSGTAWALPIFNLNLDK